MKPYFYKVDEEKLMREFIRSMELQKEYELWKMAVINDEN